MALIVLHVRDILSVVEMERFSVGKVPRHGRRSELCALGDGRKNVQTCRRFPQTARRCV